MRRHIVSSLSMLLLPVSLLAQIGTPPYASFSQNQFAAINNGNLNTILAIPMVSSPGRGISLNFSAVYNSQVWVPLINEAGANQWTQLGGWLLNSPLGGGGFYSVTDTSGTCDRQGDLTQTTYLSNYIYIDSLGTHHPFPLSVTEVYNSCTDRTTYSGTYSGYATDNSGLYASISNPALSLTAVITTKSGVSINGGTMTDTNGNMISGRQNGSETDWTDSAGRVALKIIPANSYSPTQYEFLDPTGAYQTVTLTYTTANVKTNFGCANILENSQNGASLLTTITLANGQKYSFTYEPTPGYSGYYTGRIQKVTLPTGGTYEYDYLGSNDGTSCTDGSTLKMNQVVSDGTNTATWNYVRSGGTTTITTPQLADTLRASDTVYTFTGAQATQVKIYKESPGVNVLRTINTTWATNGTPATQVTILEDGSTQSEVDTTYDSNGLLDSVSEYDWGSGTRGNLLRTTTYTYQTSTNYTSLNIINLVTSKQIKDVNSNVLYRQDIAYDATSGDNQSCPAGITQHNDSGYGCTFYYRGNPTSVTTYLTPGTPANGIIKNFTYDWFGNLRTAQLNCCQNKTWGYSSASTTNQYSVPDSIQSGTSPSLTTNYQYNAYTSQVTSSTDPNGLATNASYDLLRRPTQVSQTSGPSISMSYDDTHFTSTMKTSIDSTKSVQQITALDSLGRANLSTTEDANNNVYSKVSTAYNLAGRPYSTSTPYTGSSASSWTSTMFDALGRTSYVTLPDSSQANVSYATNTATTKDPGGNQRQSTVDGAGRLTQMLEPDPTNNNQLSLATTYTYNVLDELTQIAQGTSQTRTYTYDAIGRLITTTTPEANTVCFGVYSNGSCVNGYDNYDNLQYRTDARGVVTSYGYDGLNRLTSVSYNVSGASNVPTTAPLGFTYGLNPTCNSAHGAGCIGQLITMTDGVGSENYTYNGLEQLTQLAKVISGTTYTTSYAYNISGQLTQITYPSGRVVQQSVDAIGRLCEVAPSTTGCGTASSPYATGFGFNVASQITGLKYGNGIYASYGYNTNLQLSCLDYSTTSRNGNCTQDSTTKFGLNYSYPASPGNNGLIQGISDYVDSGRTVAYTYDSLNRLATAATLGSTNYPAWGLQETYDRYGNRNVQAIKSGCTGLTCPTFSVTASTSTNHLPSPYAYDANGNMTNDGLSGLVYDAENHAVSANMSSNTSGTYTYDGNGLRVERASVVNNVTTTTVYVFSGSKVIAEYDNGAAVGSPSREYVYSGAALLARIDSSGTKYYHKDVLSNRLVTDSTGNKLAEMGTFPYGESWYNASSEKLLFTTYERDVESGNDYAQARYDVNRAGRFNSPDSIAGSISDPQSLNRYSYVRNLPDMLIDPFGTCPGGVAENQDSDHPRDTKGSGPWASESSESAEPQVVHGHCVGGVPCQYTLGGCGEPEGGNGGGGGFGPNGMGGSAGYGFSFVDGGGPGGGGFDPLYPYVEPIGPCTFDFDGSLAAMGMCGGEGGPNNLGGGGGGGGAKSLRAILSNPDCAAILGGVTNALNLLKAANQINVSVPGYTPPSSYLSAQGQDSASFVMQNVAYAGPDFSVGQDGNTYAGGSFNIYVNSSFTALTSSQRQTIFIHELEHVYVGYGQASLEIDGMGNPFMPEPPDLQKISDNCKTQMVKTGKF